jgi:hypothetical protein
MTISSADFVEARSGDQKEQERTDDREQENDQDPNRLVLLGGRPHVRLGLERVEERPHGGNEEHEDDDELATT